MLCFDHVSYHYPGGEAVLKDISFAIHPGEQVGLIGCNGAGKSTLMKLALGLIRGEGTITAAGIPMGPRDLPRIRQKLGYVLQDSNNQMFMPRVVDDMIFGPMNYGCSREEALRRADRILEELGIGYLRDRHNHRISGGEKRMAAIAAILAMEPELMLMDEPSAALDPRNRRQMIHTLNELPVTKLIASHDLDMILETCSRVLLLSDGRIAADGPVDEILTDRALLEANGLELPFCLAGVPKRLQEKLR